MKLLSLLFFVLIAGCVQTVQEAPPMETGEPETGEPESTMSFFITSAGPGDGANLGGLARADAHCQSLAESVGAGERTWRAYLSASDGINARDRIGSGPWYNAQGVLIAQDVESLHDNATLLTKQTQLNERGEIVNGRGDTPNRHDILTGSDAKGNSLGALNSTCEDWTSNGNGSATVGHHDRIGGGYEPASWNNAHYTRGCSQENLQGTGGDGLFYCFAIN